MLLIVRAFVRESVYVCVCVCVPFASLQSKQISLVELPLKIYSSAFHILSHTFQHYKHTLPWILPTTTLVYNVNTNILSCVMRLFTPDTLHIETKTMVLEMS